MNEWRGPGGPCGQVEHECPVLEELTPVQLGFVQQETRFVVNRTSDSSVEDLLEILKYFLFSKKLAVS